MILLNLPNSKLLLEHLLAKWKAMEPSEAAQAKRKEEFIKMEPLGVLLELKLESLTTMGLTEAAQAQSKEKLKLMELSEVQQGPNSEKSIVMEQSEVLLEQKLEKYLEATTKQLQQSISSTKNDRP